MNLKYISIIIILAVVVGGWTLSYSQEIETEISSLEFREIKIPENVEVVDVIAIAKKADATVIEKQSPIAEENQKLEK